MKISSGGRSFAGAAVVAAALAACAPSPSIPVDTGSVAPGSTVTRMGQPLQLTGTPLAVGQPLPPTQLIEAGTLAAVDLARERGSVLFLSVILSVDTAV